jgi:hypothetical protein
MYIAAAARKPALSYQLSEISSLEGIIRLCGLLIADSLLVTHHSSLVTSLFIP